MIGVDIKASETVVGRALKPGDKQRRLTTIRKVACGSPAEAAEIVDRLCASIVSAGTCKAESIRAAEAAKVIENTQRDLTIVLIDELATIFNRIGLDTRAMLAAAGTKRNVLPFGPGLVGGRCIGVDPCCPTTRPRRPAITPKRSSPTRTTHG